MRGPRTGKPAWIAGRVMDAPGAAVVTSTRTDLYGLTAGLRARTGPVFVFYAAGLGDLPSTLTFDPLTGCADPVTGAHRGTDMVAAVSADTGGVRAVRVAARASEGLRGRHGLLGRVVEWLGMTPPGRRQVLSG